MKSPKLSPKYLGENKSSDIEAPPALAPHLPRKLATSLDVLNSFTSNSFSPGLTEKYAVSYAGNISPLRVVY